MEHNAYRIGELRYVVETSPDLDEWTPRPWNPLAIEVLGDGTEHVRLELTPDPPRWFHRVRIVVGE